MAWRSIVIADVRLTPAELAAMSNIQGVEATGAALLLTVVREFVGAIRAGGNAFTDDDTIPDICRVHVVNRTRWLWLCEFPILKAFQTAERSKLNDAAVEFLNSVAAGKPKTEPPATPVDAQSAANAVEVSTKSTRKFTRDKMEGL